MSNKEQAFISVSQLPRPAWMSGNHLLPLGLMCRALGKASHPSKLPGEASSTPLSFPHKEYDNSLLMFSTSGLHEDYRNSDFSLQNVCSHYVMILKFLFNLFLKVLFPLHKYNLQAGFHVERREV